MTRRDRRTDIGWIIVGGILVLVGGFYVLRNTIGLDLNWDAVWPFIVLGLGVIFLGSAVLNRGSQEPGTDPTITGQSGAPLPPAPPAQAGQPSQGGQTHP